ncbi:tyrosine--tRNA ligase [Planctellipticum variicoloris]|uniref:tyrosine--tRNA ligase n=1 Tax=Planctellipticum variicoloris TaxID=3064265 RepID=UPI003013E977|nr:tyrosine--tRNA ligase [Planctomycetaceae bacterium SH412]
MSTFAAVDEQLAIIRRGVEKIVPEEELAKRLDESRRTGKPLRIKYGIDPTGIDVHLGHTVPLRKMRQFQELGHQAVIIIGNYTALVGDPSGRDHARSKKLTAEDVERNAQDYLQQVGKVVDLSRAEIHRNGDWFGKMSFADVIQLCGKVTVAQLLTRDDFAKRYAAQSPIFLHECLYPVMQAWDSVVIKADIELGGTEQLYSFMLARDLQRDQNLPQQIGVMSPILVGLDGVRRMGKSLGNYIGISESPYEMMKKFMQLPDEVMRMYFELLTSLPLSDVEAILAGHPKAAKVRLAEEVIGFYHAAGEAKESAERWQREIGGGALPDEIPELAIPASELRDGMLPAAVLLKLSGLVASTSDARRLIAQGGAYFGEDQQAMTTHDQPIPVADGLLVKAGKKRLGRVKLT